MVREKAIALTGWNHMLELLLSNDLFGQLFGQPFSH